MSVSPVGEYGGLPAKIKATSKNLLQQVIKLEVIEIKEKDTTYYLIPIRVNNKEVLHFSLLVTPEGETTPLEVNFSKTIYAED